MTDEDIWRLNRGGHDPHKIYAAYAAAVKHKGQPTVILAKTIKGYGLGKQGQAKNPTHQLKKIDLATIRRCATASTSRSRTTSSRSCRSTCRRPDSPEMKYLHERRKALGGFLPQRRRKADGVAGGAAARRVRRGAQRLGRGPRDLHHHGVRAHPHRAGARQGARQAHRADRARRGAHLRHGGHVPPARHLRARGPEVRAGRQGPGDVLPRGQAGPDPRGRHQRGGRVLLLDRGGDLLQPLERGDGAVLHLLLDVRHAAHRRPRLGGGRPARARLPARRHRRAHHAERRGPAARGRPLAHPVLGDPELRLLRPDLRLRAGGDHPRRPAPHGDQPGGRLLLHHPDERELRASGDAAGRGGRDPQGHVPAAASRSQKRRRACSCSARAPSCAKCEAAAELLEKDWGVAADVWSATSFTELRRDGLAAERWNLLHPEGQAARALRDATCCRSGPRARWSRRATT